MATIEKITALQSVAESGVRRMWENTDYYMSFLRMSGQLYKYSFKDKVLIHENRPNAIACAEFDTWTNSDINRYIRRGSKGIPLITDRNGRLDIRYVFDFTDTGARDERSKEPFFWKITENNENAVLSALGTAASNIPDALIEKAHEIVSEQMDNYFGYFGDCIEDTFLEELDEFALQSEFQNLLEKSIAYSLLSRCGYNTDLYIDKEDFSTLYEFNGIGVMTVLGTAVSDLSEQVLRNIERTLKIERSKENEQSISKNDNRNADERGEYGVHTGRENRDVPSAGAAPAAEADRKIRSDETKVPEGALQPNVSENGTGRNAERTFVGNGRGSKTQSGADIAENAPESGNNRGAESTEPNGVDRTGEQHNSGSRGNSDNGADLQLNNGKAELNGSAFSMPENLIDIEPEIEEAGGDVPLQFTFFDTETTTDTGIEPVKVRAKSSKMALSPELELAVTEDLLMWGTGVDQGKLRVFDFYTQKHPDIKEFGQFLKKEYGISGHSGYGDSIIKFADFDAKGAKYVFNQDGERSEIKLSWDKMAERTADLIKNNRYLSAEDIDDFVKSSMHHLKIGYPADIAFREAEEKNILKRFGVDGNIKNPSASLSAEIFDLSTASVFRIPDKENAYLTNVEINASLALLERLFANGFTELEKSTGKLCYETDGENWNRFYIPDVYGNKWSNIPAEVFLRSDERAVLDEINAKIADISLGRAEAENVQTEQSEITAEDIIFSVLDKLKTVEVSEENYYSEIDNILADMLFSDDFSENEGILNDLLNDEKMKIKAFEPHLSDYAKPTKEMSGDEFIEGVVPYNEMKTITASKAGDFYEFYGETAKMLSEQFHLTLTKRNGEDMVGVPDFTFDNLCGELYEKGYIVTNWQHYQEVILHKTEEAEHSPLEDFRKKTEAHFNKIENFSAKDTEQLIKNYIIDLFSENEIEAEVGEVVLYGSRSRGLETDSSDLDFVVEIKSDLKEDALFNIIHEQTFEIGGIPIDINPIRQEESGTLENYLSLSEDYLKHKLKLNAKNIGNIEQTQDIGQRADVGELHNFIIKDDSLGVGGDKAKFRANVEAIQLLQELESENRHATPEEQEILSKYVGWGGLAQAFDENNQEWSNEFLELYTLLSEDEYKSALASTTGAYYTSPTVISAIYDGLSKLGFKKGNVLEPAMGIGNFFGMLPEEMRNSKLYGVELDSISGRIAKELYPNADIQIDGYENTAFPDNFFDVAVGNVPFGNYKLNEKRYNKLNLKIHDHFFAKSLDKVRAGGVIAFVTSKGTLDKESTAFRKYIAQRAELLGAIRLPNDAFKHNAGTEVTSDIIFLQKREKVLDIEPDWVNIGQTADGVPVNKYFEQHPEMILGEIRQGVEYSLYGDPEATACVPIEGASLKEQLKAAVSNIEGSMQKIELDSSKATAAKAFGKKEYNSIPAEAGVRNFSFTVVDDKLYYRENSQMFLQEFPKETEERIKEMIAIRDCTRTLIDYQLNEYEDEYIAKQQQKLNGLYDNFVKKFGLLNSKENTRAFADDSSLPLLTSLEILDEEGNLQRKADMFTKRTIKPQKEITHVETSTEALAVSISEKAAVNIPFMETLTGKTEEEIVQDLKGVIYLLPSSNSDNRNYVTADEYLSGNIRDKLEIAELAAKSDPQYALNVEALKQVMPKPLTATEIDVRLGATWIDKDIYQQFIYELLKTPIYMMPGIEVNFSKYTSEWQVKGKSIDCNNTLSNMTFGTSRKNAYSIIEDTLNLRASRVYDQVDDGKGGTKSVLNEKETTLAQEKQEAIKMAFKDWIFKEPNRREQLVNRYNELFNSTRPRVYDGNHLTLSGMSPEIKLRPHQLNAIAHTIYGGNTLLAHQVGAGKTFEMVASAMESKRLGMCSKSLIVVPNHLTEQMGAEFMRLYPSANILVATKKDFEAQNRRRLCSKIATGDYDAVIIGHSQLEKIPISQERQERYLKNQISDIAEGIKSLKRNRGDSFSIKRLEVTKKNLESKLKKLTESKKRDDVVTFEELGIDKMYIDEAHNFKNLFLYTKMRNVAGIQQTEAQKSSDLYLKCQYLNELTDGKGTVFATGTPVAGLQQLNTKFNFNSVFVGNPHDLNHSRGYLALFFKR